MNKAGYSIVLLCDFSKDLLSRILDVYRFFQEPPEIILVRRGERPQGQSGLTIDYEKIPLPIVGFGNSRSMKGVLAIGTAIVYIFSSALFYLRIRRSRKNVRLVHAHFVFPQGLFGLLLARLLSVPLVVTATGQDVNLLMRRNALLRALSVAILRETSATIAVSKPLQTRLESLRIINTVWQPNSVDLDSIRSVNQSAKKDSLLFVGQMTENKRPLMALRAFEHVLMQFPDARLTMCGDGPQRMIVHREILQRHLEAKVNLIPHVDPPVLNMIRSQSPIFVLPSMYEGLSLALVEAMAAGQVAVVTRNESHEAVIEHGVNGLLFHPDNAEEMAHLVVLAISDDVLRHKLSETAKRLCRIQFSNDKAGPKLEDLYLKLIDGGT